MESSLVIRRSPFATLRWLVKPAALVLSCIAIIVGLVLTKATFWLFIVALGIAMLPLSLLVLYLNFNDWRDDVYTIDESGTFRIQYRALLKYKSVREGPIAALQDVWVVQRGIARLLFHYGDIYMQVGWSRVPFKLRDVQDPYAERNRIRRLATYYHENRNNPQSNVDVMATLLERFEEESN